MKQLTEPQAIEFFQQDFWRQWESRDLAVFQLFQERLCTDISMYKAALSNLLKRPILTHVLLNYLDFQCEYCETNPVPHLRDFKHLIPKDNICYKYF